MLLSVFVLTLLLYYYCYYYNNSSHMKIAIIITLNMDRSGLSETSVVSTWEDQKLKSELWGYSTYKKQYKIIREGCRVWVLGDDNNSPT